MRYIKTKNWKKLDTEIVANIKNILHECELYNAKEDEVYVVELNKLRKWEIQEKIGEYFNWIDSYGDEYEWNFRYCRMKSFCKAFDITEDEIAYYYARGISESGYYLAYELNKDMVLVIE